MICSVSSGDPKARKPRMWVTLFTSQPSESMLTHTMARTCSPGLPFEPTVFTISRITASLPLSASNTFESIWIVIQRVRSSSSGLRNSSYSRVRCSKSQDARWALLATHNSIGLGPRAEVEQTRPLVMVLLPR